MAAGYFGAKTGAGLHQAIIAAMPPHETFIETHLGSGVVMRAKPPADRQIGIDLDPQVIRPLVRAMPGAARRTELYCCDAVEFLEAFHWSTAGRVVIYADPPYVQSTRAARRYRHDYTDDDHRRLIGCLRQVPAAVILSGYPSALYDQLVGDWRSVELQVMTRGGPRTEKLWFNFPAGEVQWASFAGRDRTDRQRIKRKASRWAAHYRRLSPGERLAVLAALLAEPPAS